MTYKILLVDGDAARAAKRRGPLADAGHEVAVAGSPDAALLSFERSRPHLVVIDATQGEATIRDLSGLLKKQAPDVPLVLLTDVVRDPQQIALVLNQYGCDQLIDRSLAPDRMLRLIGQLVDSAKGHGAGASGGTDSAGATLWLDSEELVNALEKLDTIITHKAASQVQAPGHAEMQVNVDRQVDRDVQARRFVDDVDRGADIDDHLDTVFSRGRGTTSPQQQPPQQPAPPAARPTPPAREQVVVKTSQALRSDARATVAMPVLTPPQQPKVEPKPAPVAAPQSAEMPRVEPRPSDVAIGLPHQAPASTVRWIVAATIVVTLLGAGYLVLFRGSPSASPVNVAANGTGASEAPPFTPAADGQADPQKGVQSAAPTLPAVPAPKPAPPQPTPAPTAKPQVAKAPPKPQKAQKPKPTPVPAAKVSAPKPPSPTPAPVEVAQAVVPSSAPEPSPEPKAIEPPPAPVIAAVPKPAKIEPGPLVPATVMKRVEPTYSPKAVKGIGDPRVVLRVLVDAQGRITRVLVDKGIPGSDLEAAAVSAVLRWQFQPGSQDGKPVESWATAEFKFSE